MITKIYNYKPNFSVIENIPKEAQTLLDIGCGNGGLADYVKDVKIDGITYSEKEYQKAKKKLNKVFLWNLENGVPPDLPNYDVIIASHVIEHIAYPEKLLQSIKKIMHYNSIMIVAIPNIMHYKYRIKLCLGKFEYENSGVMDYTHLRWYTYKSCKQLLENQGFNIIKCYADGKLPLYKISKILPERLQKISKKLLYTISKGLFGEQFIYIVKK